MNDLGSLVPDNGHRVSKIVVYNSVFSLMMLSRYVHNLGHQVGILFFLKQILRQFQTYRNRNSISVIEFDLAMYVYQALQVILIYTTCRKEPWNAMFYFLIKLKFNLSYFPKRKKMTLTFIYNCFFLLPFTLDGS